jgi:N-acyl homoserine lactone hydrolase
MSATVPSPGQSLELSMGCYLIETGDGAHILVDTGMAADSPLPPGTPPASKGRTVLDHLADLELKPGDIDMVICTHFDVDHCGYNDSFPQAEFIVQRSHYEQARGGHPRYAAARPHWDHPSLRYRLVDGEVQLLPGLTLLETSGHAFGHQSVLVGLPQTGSVLLAIDAVMLERLFTPDRTAWPGDDNQDQLRANTRKLLELVERERVALVVFGHDGAQWRTLKRAPEYYE